MPEGGIPSVLTGALQFGIKPGLERINRLLELLGDPQDQIKAVHVAGTNGKGSVCTFLSTILACDGKKVGTIKNGAKGDEGSSCEGKVEKDGSITIKCDGEKVGTLKNGENGDASSCTASQNKAKDGYDIVCGGTKIASVKNGKDGKSAFELAQEIDGTFADEAAWLESLKNSVGCTFEEDDLYLSITCGKDPSVKILKALCAGKLYDPEKYFCYADKPYPRCGKIATEKENNWTSIPSNALATGGTYDAKTYFCAANNLLYQRCGLEGAYDPMRKFCSDQSLLDLCGGKNYDPDKAFCDRRGKGTVYSTALINGRLWMTENLNYQPDDAKEGEIFCKDSTAADGKCGTEGRLYTFAAAEKYCPSGWVLPTYDDWKSLQTSYPNRASLESSDFKPQYGGVCTPELNCYNVGVTGKYWSQTPSTAESNVWVFSYSTNSSNVNISNSYTSDGYGASVRCRHRYVMPQSEQE